MKKNFSSQKYSWYVVLLSSLIGILSTATFSQFSMIVSPLALQMEVDESFLLFTDSIKSLVIMMGMIFSGVAYKLLGYRNLFILAALCQTIPSFIIPSITSPLLLVFFKVIQGLFGLMFPIFIIIILGWVKNSQSGFATALFNGLFYGGAGIGAAISGVIYTSLGWESTFYVLGIFTLGAGILWVLTVKENPNPETQKKEYKDNSFSSKLSKQNEVSLIKQPITWLLICFFFSSTWVVQALSLDIPVWAEALGYDSSTIGLIMTSLTFGFLLGTIFSGKLSDIVSNKKKNKAISRILVMGIGPSLTIFSVFSLLLIDQTNFTLFFIFVLLSSFAGAWGLGSFYCILPEIYSRSSLTYTTGFIGGVADVTLPLAPLVVGVVFGSQGFWTLGWGTCILLSLISFIAMLFLVKLLKAQDIE